MRRFFSDHIESGIIHLDHEESRHLSKVLRLRIGDKVEVVDGNGGLYQCEISDNHKEQSTLKVLTHRTDQPEAAEIWMGVAPTKNLNRWEWFLEKSTEIGISRISPIICENSERKVLKQDRQMRILKEAMKQSRRLFLPTLDELKSYADLLQMVEAYSDFEKFIAHCEDDQKSNLKELYKKGKKALILIGAEGDFTNEEIDRARLAGFKEISLGGSRLRTETAAIVACHSINFINE